MLPQLQAQDLGTIGTSQLAPLGTKIFLGADQARKGYVYASFPTSTATTAGKLLVSAAAPANSTGLALPTTNTTAMFSSGSTVLYVTNGATAVTLNQFQDGVLEVIGTNGTGQSYRIAGNTADSAGSAQLTISLAEPLRNTTALANGTNTVNLRVAPTSLPAASASAALPVGVTIMPIASNTTSVQYGWLQVFGDAYVSAPNSGTKGQQAAQDLSTAGGVANNAADTTAIVGIFKESAASSLASVFLNIPC
jgi:hypothetical protein